MLDFILWANSVSCETLWKWNFSFCGKVFLTTNERKLNVQFFERKSGDAVLPPFPPPPKKISEEQIIVQYWIICFASEATPK